ncbi:MAG: hypothetical protein Q9211_001402 [Gyalolechia sp. 1 TL-2023]
MLTHAYSEWNPAMFDILEADIVVFQETKIQRKDLVDDMVLVPGWDCYWSLPKHKKGTSKESFDATSVCAPIRAEEGITGVLCPPSSAVSFSEGPDDRRIGGYPTQAQLEASPVDATTLDSEGRCVILEFPAFVLIGVYSPANRDETRDDFRLSFLDLLDARIRNLADMGKRVLLTGDLNISRDERDTANAEAAMRKNGYTREDYLSTPARRMFNQLLEGGRVVEARDEGRDEPVLWDICRGFHPDRKGMFTCWEQKVNARPGNYGSRIDYVLCSSSMKTWFSDSNIQEGLMGSDHCPVYAVIKDQVEINGRMVFASDIMNPPGMFMDGKRQREYSTTDMLPLSGKLIPEFDGRRNIRDMFARTPSLPNSSSTTVTFTAEGFIPMKPPEANKALAMPGAQADTPGTSGTARDSTRETALLSSSKKRSAPAALPQKPLKRSKSGTAASAQPPATGKGQQSLRGFLMAKSTAHADSTTPLAAEDGASQCSTSDNLLQPAIDFESRHAKLPRQEDQAKSLINASSPSTPASPAPGSTGTHCGQASPWKGFSSSQDAETVRDPIQSKESWSKLFTKPAPPLCEGHQEPCKTMLTKKNGMNRGRSFWMCARPLGPSGDKEKYTQWRCHTFIWCSDWNPTTST